MSKNMILEKFVRCFALLFTLCVFVHLCDTSTHTMISSISTALGLLVAINIGVVAAQNDLCTFTQCDYGKGDRTVSAPTYTCTHAHACTHARPTRRW